MKLMTNGRKALLAGVALVGCLGFAFNAQAQTCTISNWAGGATNLADGDTGTQGASNRRYGGPCGLQVDIDGTQRFVSDNSPQSETTYIARFYAFLDNAGSDPMIIFAADDGADDQIQVWYNFPNAGDLTLRVYDNGGGTNDLTESAVGSGWHSIEFAWDAAATSDIRFSVDGAADLTASPDTSGLAIVNAHLGNVDGTATGGGSVDFDDFDSRRIERPGRLLVGDANDDATINVFDISAIIDEVQTGTFAPGQPDCNEDGSINVFDISCLIDIIQS
ncbi:hypothetical protein [Wenzhouxiangella sediminis]|uniref:Dockerin domain-containing protein n=1 Tax=Wenzhouxiangella sediminis TaxID=1792836 RepID=A0A3E1K9J2_9GAMM|nr:hypothetical protein [Wenzhouxiangella sediminis]RFF30799.1 hypothetical protein DZC52_06710 [Wenzhouxiangella sediminis]